MIESTIRSHMASFDEGHKTATPYFNAFGALPRYSYAICSYERSCGCGNGVMQYHCTAVRAPQAFVGVSQV